MGKQGKIFTKDFLYNEYIILGKRIAQIAREQHCLGSRVSQQLHDYDISVKKKPYRAKVIEKILTKEFLQKQYVELKKTSLEIEKETGIYQDTICSYLHKHNIDIRGATGQPIVNMIGREFGRLKVISFSHVDAHCRAFWLCKCKCEKVVIVSGKELRRKNFGTKSCGCLRRDIKYDILPGTVWLRIVNGAKSRGLTITITPEYIEELFRIQLGKCALSGIDIILSPSAKLRTASLDRIDSKFGYEPGNVQWVHKTVNLMKQDFEQNEFLAFCTIIGDKCCKLKSLSDWRNGISGLFPKRSTTKTWCYCI